MSAPTRVIAGVERHLGGYRRNIKDDRDYPHERLYGAAPFTPSATFGLRSDLTALAIYDQGREGSCLFNVLCRQCRALCVRDDAPVPDLSRQYPYYAARCWIGGGRADDDCGSTPRQAMTAAQRFGICPEALWPYTMDNFANCPTKDAIHAAYDHQVLEYGSALTLRTIQTAIERDRVPVMVGFMLPAYFESDACAKDGVVPYYPSDEIIGGHGMLVEGWETLPSGLVMLEIANSWGAGWGDGGYAHADARYLTESSQIGDGTVITREEE